MQGAMEPLGALFSVIVSAKSPGQLTLIPPRGDDLESFLVIFVSGPGLLCHLLQGQFPMPFQ